jgi:hypothetical protein
VALVVLLAPLQQVVAEPVQVVVVAQVRRPVLPQRASQSR